MRSGSVVLLSGFLAAAAVAAAEKGRCVGPDVGARNQPAGRQTWPTQRERKQKATERGRAHARTDHHQQEQREADEQVRRWSPSGKKSGRMERGLGEGGTTLNTNKEGEPKAPSPAGGLSRLAGYSPSESCGSSLAGPWPQRPQTGEIGRAHV